MAKSRILRARHCAGAGLILLGFALSGAQAADIPNQYIVTVDRAALDRSLGRLPLLDAVQTLLASVGGGRVLMVYEQVLPGFAARMSPLQATLIASLPGVRAVEPDRLMWLSATQTGANYHLDRLDQRDLQPLDGRFRYPDRAGSGVHVYVIDTGLNAAHADFSGRVGAGRNFAANSSGLLGPGPTDPANTSDCNGHGTHVAGLAAGTTHGVAKRATVHPVRVFSCSGETASSLVIAGMDWVRSNHVRPAVVNLSVGGEPSSATDEAVRNLVNAGIATIVSAGNDTDDACRYSPSREPAAIAVGSSTNTDGRSSFSNFGACVDLFAPGSNIVSASHSSSTGTATMSGTSMASPLTAGAAAVVLSQTPAASPSQVRNTLIADATQNRIGDPRGSPNRLLYVADSGGSAPADQLPVARFTFSCSGLVCDFNGASSSDDSGITAYSWNFGDGRGGNGATVRQSYAANGTYTVTLTVTDRTSQTGSETRSVTVASGPKSAPCTSCTRYSGSLAAGGSVFHPGANGYTSNGGLIRGHLLGPAGANFDLVLQKRSSMLIFTSWTDVAATSAPGATETLSYSGTAGTYRFLVRARSGSGAYEFYLEDN